MIAYFIYFLVFCILSFVIYIAGKALNRGMESKKKIREQSENHIEKLNSSFKKNKTNEKFLQELNELKKLYDDGVLSEEEFKKGKDKILR
tara:strand:+ start:283 stop:552 length:270 start_codon:yes stop_codon:yes gene_type:complete